MPNVVSLYTVVTGDKDPIIEQAFPITRFSDSYDKFADNRRNSRIQKILAHKYFDAEFTIYMDGNMKLLVSPEELVEKYMAGFDMALFKHGVRNCIYDEALECARLGLDDVETIIEQAKHYEDLEYEKHKGLYQGGFIIRRNNERVRRFEEAWWADFCRYSRRDQLSMMPAIDRSGVLVNTIPGHWVEEGRTASIKGILEMVNHKHFEGNFNEAK